MSARFVFCHFVWKLQRKLLSLLPNIKDDEKSINKREGKDGKILPEEGKLIRQMFNKRREGDYEDFEETTEEEIQEAMPKVKELVDKLISLNSLTVNKFI